MKYQKISVGDHVICVSNYYEIGYRCDEPKEGWTGIVESISKDGTIAWVSWHKRGYIKSVSVEHIERICTSASGQIDVQRTELVHRILSVFDEVLKNTPDYAQRRSATFTQVAEILSDFERNSDKGLADNRLKIEVWEARHAVVCWWNETPIKRGMIDLDGLEDMMVSIIKSHSKIRDSQKSSDDV